MLFESSIKTGSPLFIFLWKTAKNLFFLTFLWNVQIFCVYFFTNVPFVKKSFCSILAISECLSWNYSKLCISIGHQESSSGKTYEGEHKLNKLLNIRVLFVHLYQFYGKMAECGILLSHGRNVWFCPFFVETQKKFLKKCGERGKLAKFDQNLSVTTPRKMSPLGFVTNFHSFHSWDWFFNR